MSPSCGTEQAPNAFVKVTQVAASHWILLKRDKGNTGREIICLGRGTKKLYAFWSNTI